MDKTLFKAYVRTIVEEEVKKILPEMLSEAVEQIKKAQLNESSTSDPKPTIDRGKLAEILGISYDGETLRAGTNDVNMIPEDRVGRNVNPAVKNAINRDYSDVMKKLNLS